MYIFIIKIVATEEDDNVATKDDNKLVFPAIQVTRMIPMM